MSTPVRRAIYGKLAGDGGSGGLLDPASPMLGAPGSGYGQPIYHDQAPADAGFPFIVLSKSSGVPTETFGAYQSPPNSPTPPGVLDSDLWLIKAIVRGDDVLGESPSDRADRIAARIKTLLNDAALTISNLALLYLRRESDVEYAELADGVVYRHCGALYRLITTNP